MLDQRVRFAEQWRPLERDHRGSRCRWLRFSIIGLTVAVFLEVALCGSPVARVHGDLRRQALQGPRPWIDELAESRLFGRVRIGQEPLLRASPRHRAHLDNTTLTKAGHADLGPMRAVASTSSLLTRGRYAGGRGEAVAALGRQRLPAERLSAQQAPRLQTPSRGFRAKVYASGAGLPDHTEDDDDDKPPVLTIDPRDFRARLVAAERVSGSLDAPAQTREGGDRETPPSAEKSDAGWMYETTLLEMGSVLLWAPNQEAFGFALQQQYFHKSVIFIVSYGSQLSKGIILNRPTTLQLDGWPVWYGGDWQECGLFEPNISLGFRPTEAEDERHASPDVTCLHRLKNESIRAMSTCVIKDIYNISFDSAKHLVSVGMAAKEDFWVFAGYVGLEPENLMRAVERNAWYLTSADSALLVGELLAQGTDPSALPRFDPHKGQLLPGGDGIRTWERLAANIGRKDTSQGDFADRMLREWVLVHLTEEGQTWPRPSIGPSITPKNGPINSSAIDVGTVLVSSSTRPFILEKPYLHKAIFMIVHKDEDMIIATVLNRPKMKVVAFAIPGQAGMPGTMVERRVSFGGDDKQLEFAHIMPFHRKRGMGGEELGDSGVFMVDHSFAGEANDLLLVTGVIAWSPPADLTRQIEQGTFTVVPKDKVPWGQLWECANISAMHSNILEERISDLRRREKDEFGELEVLKDRAVRMMKKSCEAWQLAMSGTGSAVVETSEEERKLADDALFEWSKEDFLWDLMLQAEDEESDESGDAESSDSSDSDE